MYVLLFLFLLAATLFCHEFGHLHAAVRHGVRAASLEVGACVPYLTIEIRHPRFCYGVPVRFSPLLVWGLVKFDADAYERLDYKSRLEIDGSGIVMSFFASSALLLTIARNPVMFGAAAASCVALLVFRRQIAIYLLPALSALFVAFVPFVLVGFAKMVKQPGKDTGEMAQAMFGISDPAVAVVWAAAASFFIALLNLLPLYPLDGGQLVVTCAKRWLPGKGVEIYRVLCTLFMLALLALSAIDLVAAVVRQLLRLRSH